MFGSLSFEASTGVYKYIRYALEGALRMQTLVQDLLTFSRVGRNRQRTDLASDETLQGALQNLQAALQESGAIVQHDGLPAVSADRTQLVQLFQKRITNCVSLCSFSPQEHGSKFTGIGASPSISGS
jgi:light-regulated signal transduction histidine kinase (bacteriophytochrome)